MERNTVIAIVLSVVVVVAGFSVQNYLYPPSKTPTAQQKTLPEPNQNQSVTATSSVVSETPATPLESPVVADVPAETAALPVTETKYVIETDLIRAEFTNKGGDIVSYKLKKHSSVTGDVEMADYVTDQNRAFSIILGNENVVPLNDLFNVKVFSDKSIGFYRDYKVKNSDGTESAFTLVKQYSFLPDDYMFELKVTVDGESSLNGLKFGNVAYTLTTSPQIGPKWNEKQESYEFRKFFQMSNGKKKIFNLGSGKIDRSKDSVTWAAIAGKYFALIAYPDNGIQQAVYSRVPAADGATTAQMFLSRSPITANKNTDTWHIYIGPKTDKDLSKYNVETNNQYKLSDAQLDSVVESSGILGPLEVLLKWMMEFFYKLIPNWGVSIIILTILMRLVLFPLTKKSSIATLKMQELQPKIKEIQDKYKNNPQKMNEEMAKFYQTAGYNPLSGCLPVLIQFPLIFAMYNLFNNYFEFRGAMFIPGWIPDLSIGDKIVSLGFTIPMANISDLRLLPIIYVISQLFYGKITQTPGATQQNSSMKMMMYGMPLIFFFIFYNAPSGLLIYWIFSNVLTLAQQVVINRMIHKSKKPVTVPAKK